MNTINATINQTIAHYSYLGRIIVAPGYTICQELVVGQFGHKVISEALGHASVAFTKDTYSHIISGMQNDAMALLDEFLPAGVSQRINVSSTSYVKYCHLI